MMKALKLEDFIPHGHGRFQVAGEVPLELELTSATDHSNAQLEQFSLIFTGPVSPCLPQRLYELFHPGMGNVELFLVPVGPGETGMLYEAAFSRFIESR
jgi:uncharacterized protein DUF6916